MIGGQSADPRLARVLANAQAGQWSADEAIDWRQAPRPTRWLPRRMVIRVVSQIYHAEVATGRLCHQLAAQLDDPTARACLDLQIADEERHAQVYHRYLGRLGDIAPAEPAVSLALAAGFAAPGGALGRMVACHLVLESQALSVLDQLSRAIDCPLLGVINRLAAQDEARHLAFGRVYLKDKVEALPLEQRMAIYHWIKGVWRDCAEAAVDSFGGTRILARGRVERQLSDGWARQCQGLRDAGLVPAPHEADRPEVA